MEFWATEYVKTAGRVGRGLAGTALGVAGGLGAAYGMGAFDGAEAPEVPETPEPSTHESGGRIQTRGPLGGGGHHGSIHVTETWGRDAEGNVHYSRSH